MLTRQRAPGGKGKTLALAAIAAISLALGPQLAHAEVKHYFRVIEVLGSAEDGIRQKGRELLVQELDSRALFSSDLGAGEVTAAMLQAQGRRGFDVTLRFEALTKELKDPAPGRKLKQLVVGVRISVMGSDIVGRKLAFSGDGESMQLVEVDERRLEKDTAGLVNDVLADAIKQAVNQAVLKLSSSKPTSPGKAKRRKSKSGGEGGGAAR